MPATLRSPCVIALIATAGAAACSKESDKDGFGDQAAPIVCAKVYECCTAMEVMGHTNYSPDRATCEEQTRDSLGFWAALMADEEKKGRLIFRRDVASKCLQSFGAATCEAHKRNDKLDGCDSYIEPLTPLGAACAANESCVGGACRGLSPGTEGVCKAFAAEGESCKDTTCAKGLYCAPGGSVCRPAQADGATCYLHAECSSAGCNGRNADAGTSGTCGLKGGEGNRCFVTVGCSLSGRAAAGSGGAAILALLLALGGAWLRISPGRRRAFRRPSRSDTRATCPPSASPSLSPAGS